MNRKLLNWREHPPLVEARTKLDELVAAAREAETRLEAARERLDTLRARLADLEGALVLNRVTADDVARVAVEVEAGEEEAARLEAEHRKLRRAEELLEGEVPSLEQTAKAIVRTNFHTLYRRAVAQLRDAVAAAIQTNTEVAELYEQAASQFEESADRDPFTHKARSCFLPWFALPELEQGSIEPWFKAVGAYLNANEEAEEAEEAEEPAAQTA